MIINWIYLLRLESRLSFISISDGKSCTWAMFSFKTIFVNKPAIVSNASKFKTNDIVSVVILI